ncbi:MAG: HD domain-containing protein [Roseiflexaceae bacterium]
MVQNQALSGLVQLCERIIMLKRMPRMGWLQRGVPHPESVADHSFSVAALAITMAAFFPDLQRNRVAELAILHDLGEVLLTDLPLSAQHLLGKPAKQAAELQAIDTLFADLPHHDQLIALWQEYTQASTPEARFIKALDRIELLAQALAYEQAGQRNLAEFWQGYDQGWDEFPLLGQLAATLVQQRP